MKRSFLERAFGRLVRLLPRAFVAEYGPDMAATFERRIVAARARGRARLALFLAREVGGLVRVVVVEYAAALKTVIFRAFERPTDRATEPTLRRREPMRNVGQDLKHGWRGLGRNPGFTAAVVVVLALGIGATTAMFTMLNAVLLRPLPLPDADRLVGFGNPTLVRQVSSGPPRTDLFSYELYTELRNGSSLVPALLASGPTTLLDVVVADATGAAPDDEPEHPRARLVSGNYFDVLGVRAQVGRTFTPDEDRGPGTGPVTVISHEYWKRLPPRSERRRPHHTGQRHGSHNRRGDAGGVLRRDHGQPHGPVDSAHHAAARAAGADLAGGPRNELAPFDRTSP